MQKDRVKWNEKHRKKRFSAEPSLIVKKYCRSAPIGKALDIAAGNGRNAVFLANQGFDVEAVDISDQALIRLSGRHPNVRPVCADLDYFDIRVLIPFYYKGLFHYYQNFQLFSHILLKRTFT